MGAKTKKIFLPLAFILSGFVLSSCSHSHNVAGEEAKSEIPAGIRVSIGSKEVKEGDVVDVLKTTCENVAGGGRHGGTKRVCTDNKIGEAVVLKVLDHDAAIVQPSANLKMDSSMKVESQKH